ncbi:MAG: tRNA pseudouridine(55) synthase TruB [Lachnospiraceae bacterium]|nr:tRNA pseudouridine(55) synthase TruB [Lachnospiraceae bacterium]
MNGIINVYKEAGFTSFDVVAKLRGILKQKKIGHTGTLDPDAVGVLPVCLGSATKLCDMLTDKKKEYIAEFVLGKVTDTQDVSGTVLEEKEVACTKEEVAAVIASFIGTYEQLPPMYSAIKVDGKRLYELARQGKEVERKTRPVTLYEIEVLKMELPLVSVRVLCSKGTYIRTLCHDIGMRLDCGAVMTSLKRTASGQFGLDTAHTLAEIEVLRDSGKLDSAIIPVDEVFKDLPAIIVDGELERKILNGNYISWSKCKPYVKYGDGTTSGLSDGGINSLCCEGQLFRVYKTEDNSCNFMAVYCYKSEKKGVVPEKMFLG